MSATQLQHQISERTKNLPVDMLNEIADFIDFLAYKKSHERIELGKVSQLEEQHLEQEFNDYKQLYPVE